MKKYNIIYFDLKYLKVHKVPMHFLHLSVWLAVLTLAQLFIRS